MIEHHVSQWKPTTPISAVSWVRPALAVAAIGWGANQFAPLIVLYQRHGISASATEIMFGLYAVGLIPALLVGGRWSDRVGRKVVVMTALVLSMVASLVLMAGSAWEVLLFPGRCVAGVGSGLAFGTGAAWIRELSAGHGHPHAGARRATTAMTAGFGGGPVVAGLIAQWAPDPRMWSYVPHLILCVAALVLLARFGSVGGVAAKVAPQGISRPEEVVARHLLVIAAPFAPWVFGTAGIALAYLPGVVAAHAGSHQLAFAAAATTIPAVAGVLVQPLVARVNIRRAARLRIPAMLVAVAALIVAVWAAAVSTVWAVLVAVAVLGAAYGVTQFAGLADIQHIARPAQLGTATSAYQALSYLGFALPYLLTLSQSRFGWSPVRGLSVVVILAVVATVWLSVADRTRRPRTADCAP